MVKGREQRVVPWPPALLDEQQRSAEQRFADPRRSQTSAADRCRSCAFNFAPQRESRRPRGLGEGRPGGVQNGQDTAAERGRGEDGRGESPARPARDGHEQVDQRKEAAPPDAHQGGVKWAEAEDCQLTAMRHQLYMHMHMLGEQVRIEPLWGAKLLLAVPRR